MNEEEVKVKVVLPFLRALGFDAAALQLETSFYLRLGRHVLDITSGKTTEHEGAGARLDILVKRNGENLFIVETKAEDQQLTDADRDQAVSYARLVHPIAPYALLTNGTAWKIFDSVSKQEISLGEFPLRDRYEVVLPKESREEALNFFFGYSQGNVLRFCEAQISESLKPLRGSATDLQKKYIPDLHVPDNMLLGEMQKFLAGGKTGFLILSDSGLGKTCEMCYHALRLLNAGEAAILFFQGFLLESGIAAAVMEEFNWTFSEQQTSVELFRRLKFTLKDRPVVLFVDAIDEWTYPQKYTNFHNFLRLAQNYSIKVIFSCKSASWSNFAARHGAATGIEEFLHKVESESRDGSAYILRGFNRQALYTALAKYSACFNIRPQFENAVLEEACRNPFLLRVFFAVAKGSGLRQFTFSSSEFFKAYYEQLLSKTGNRELADAQVQAIAKVLYEANQDAVELQVVRTKLGLGLNETLLPALFEYNVLTKSNDTSARVGFYFQQLRDFLVSFAVRRWPGLSKADFAAAVNILKGDGVHADILSFYYRHASEEQKRAVDGPLFDNAKKYLDLYTQIITQHFPALMVKFSPGTNRRIGFIAQIVVSRRCLFFYGFREIGDKDAEIMFIPIEASIGQPSLMDLYETGELHYSGSAWGFNQIDVQNEVLENEIERQLKSMVDKELLNEEMSIGLLHERLVSIVLAKPDIFQKCFVRPGCSLQVSGPQNRRRILQYPLSYQEIRKMLIRACLFGRFADELLEEKRKRGEIEEIWQNNFVSFSGRITEEEKCLIERKVENAIETGEVTGVQDRYHQELASELESVLQALERNGTATEQQWSERSTLFDAIREDPIQGVATVKEYLAKLISAFLEDYKNLIDLNFPTLRPHFSLRNQMPLCVLIGLDPRVVDAVRSGNHIGVYVHILYCQSVVPISENIVLVGDASELHGRSPEFEFRGKRYRGLDFRQESLLVYTFSSDAVIGMKRQPYSYPLHRLVYGKVRGELHRALTMLRNTLKIPNRQGFR